MEDVRWNVSTAGLEAQIKKTEQVLLRRGIGEKMKYYKVLGPGGVSCHGGNARWSLPHDGQPGDWMPEIKGKLVACNNGYHLCRREDLILWINEEIYEAEYEGEIVESDEKVVVRKCRLLSRFTIWNKKTIRLFAADCAEHVLPIYEKSYPDDQRPRLAIQSARDFANGKISSAAQPHQAHNMGKVNIDESSLGNQF